VLPARDGFPRKVKPLVRLSERETAAYCIVSGIDYLVDECPMAAGNKHLGYKEALNEIEVRSPGSKADFYFSFLRRAADRFEPDGDDPTSADPGDDGTLRPCARCGSPTSTEVCAFCRLVDRAGGRAPDGPVVQPVTITPRALAGPARRHDDDDVVPTTTGTDTP
jgi:uncharacterized protein (TIGR00269 family)